ncbi:hypothetical protein [Halomonas cupida]|uniref:hypothetical protein n=1 Tax=Halomonas cupida TaxID=44933 RepID=UPI003A8D3ECC
MRIRFPTSVLVISAAALLISGCANRQAPVAMHQSVWQEKHERIGVTASVVNQPQLYKIGPQGLLDLAINNEMTLDLREAMQDWDNQALKDIPQELAASLEDRGYEVVMIPEPLRIEDFQEVDNRQDGYSAHDFRPLKPRYQIDKLIVVSIGAHGLTRSYYGFIPTSDPVATVNHLSSVIDLDDNRYLLHQSGSVEQAAEGEWDQPPLYPHLAEAYSKAIEQARQDILAEFQNQPATMTTP